MAESTPAGTASEPAPAAEIARLNRIIDVLMDRAERGVGDGGSDFALFQNSVMLEELVRIRTRELEDALHDNEEINRALKSAQLRMEREIAERKRMQAVLEQERNEQRALIGRLEDTRRKLLASDAELRRHRDHLSDLVAEQTRDLIEARDVAEKASALKSEFLANMSHEFRTPLHGILSFAMLGTKRIGQVPEEKLKDYFERIQVSGTRLTRLVDDLLDLSKLEAGKMVFRITASDVVPVIERVRDELAGLIHARRLEVTVDAGATSTTARIDPERFHNVVLNLFSNAIKFSPEGGRIEVCLTDGVMPDGVGAFHDALLVSLRDHGVGIPEGECEAIFDKFVQSSSTKTGAGGTGLGLAICREIMQYLHGRITARNHPDGGAVFELLLPRQVMTARSSAH